MTTRVTTYHLSNNGIDSRNPFLDNVRVVAYQQNAVTDQSLELEMRLVSLGSTGQLESFHLFN